jgi:hypothetical protein
MPAISVRVLAVGAGGQLAYTLVTGLVEMAVIGLVYGL